MSMTMKEAVPYKAHIMIASMKEPVNLNHFLSVKVSKKKTDKA